MFGHTKKEFFLVIVVKGIFSIIFEKKYADIMLWRNGTRRNKKGMMDVGMPVGLIQLFLAVLSELI
jgi:hypothetical protein